MASSGSAVGITKSQLVLETPSTWDGGESGTSWVSIFHPDGLPPGLFELELEVQGELFQTGSFTVQEMAASLSQQKSA